MKSLKVFSRIIIAAVLCRIGDIAIAQAFPVFSPPGGVFSSNVQVSITVSTGEVRYTLDGSAPATNSALYTAPLLLSNSCVLRACAFTVGNSTGPVAAATFTLLETNFGEFNSTLPLLVIQTFGKALQGDSNITAAVRFVDATATQRATVQGPAAHDGQAELKIRGFTSRRYPKRSLSVELLDPAGNSIAAPLLGMPPDSDWVLYAPYPDKSLLRDVLAYELSNQIGRYASRTRFVEVFLNETNGPLSRAHYAGIHVLEEKIRASPHRVNVQKLSPDDNAEPAISGGYIFKKDHLEKVRDDDPPPPRPAGAAPSARAGRIGYPTGPGAFPADSAGFLPPYEEVITLTNVVTTTNIAQITNLVALTNLTPITSIVAVTSISALTNVAFLTNAFTTTNITTTRHVSTVTNVLTLTNVASVTNIASIPNQPPFPGAASFTNITTFTNVAVFTNIASVTNSVFTTNLAAVASITPITNITAITNFAASTNIAAATNVEITTSLVWMTNIHSVTNLTFLTNNAATLAAAASGAATNSPPPTGAPPSVLTRLIESGQGFVTSRTNPFFYVEPKAGRITPAQRAWLSNYINRFEQALYGPDFRNPTNGYAAFIDADTFIDHHLIVEATKNIDGFRFSAFFHKERGGKIKMGPIWDWNLSLGNATGKQGADPEHWYWPQLDDRQYSWFRRLFEDPDFAQRYVDRWAELRASHFAATNLLARIDAWVATLKEPAARNFERWPILGQVINTEPFAGKTWDEEIQYLKTWTTNRLAWMTAQFVAPPVLTSAEMPVPAGAFITLTAATGRIYFTLDGSDPRLPGGAVSPAARPFEQPLPVTTELKNIIARTQKENRWSSPLKLPVTIKPTVTAKGDTSGN